MAKYKVFFIGHKTFICNDENQAINLAEQQLENIPDSFNLDVSGVREENQNGTR